MSGKDGDVTYSCGDNSVHSWTLSYVGDALETTDFDDSAGGRSFIPGIKSWSGSYECYYSSGNLAAPGTTGSIILKMSTGGTVGFQGDIVLTGMDITTAVDGIVTQTYTFQGNGALSASTV